jgi:hypothetical protein
MGDYRRNRIDQYLSNNEKLDLNDFKEMLRDTYSPKAKKFVEVIKTDLLKELKIFKKFIKTKDVSYQIIKEYKKKISKIELFIDWNFNYNKKNIKNLSFFDEFYYQLNLDVYSRIFDNKYFFFNI